MQGLKNSIYFWSQKLISEWEFDSQRKLKRCVWRMDAELRRLRCYCTIASQTKKQHEIEFPDAHCCKYLQFDQLWDLWSLASGFEEIKPVCSSWSIMRRKTNYGSKMKHTVHETDFLCRHKLLFLRVWPRSSQTVPVNAERHCHCSLGVQPADLETSASCSCSETHGHGDLWMGEGGALGEER